MVHESRSSGWGPSRARGRRRSCGRRGRWRSRRTRPPPWRASAGVPLRRPWRPHTAAMPEAPSTATVAEIATNRPQPRSTIPGRPPARRAAWSRRAGRASRRGRPDRDPGSSSPPFQPPTRWRTTSTRPNRAVTSATARVASPARRRSAFAPTQASGSRWRSAASSSSRVFAVPTRPELCAGRGERGGRDPTERAGAARDEHDAIGERGAGGGRLSGHRPYSPWRRVRRSSPHRPRRPG